MALYKEKLLYMSIDEDRTMSTKQKDGISAVNQHYKKVRYRHGGD